MAADLTAEGYNRGGRPPLSAYAAAEAAIKTLLIDLDIQTLMTVKFIEVFMIALIVVWFRGIPPYI